MKKLILCVLVVCALCALSSCEQLGEMFSSDKPHEHTIVIDAGREPTCVSLGSTDRYRCSVCNAIITERTLLPLTSHTPVIDEGYPATSCSASGLSEGSHCAVCNVVLAEQTVLPPLSHTLVLDAGYPATFLRKGLRTVCTAPCAGKSWWPKR